MKQSKQTIHYWCDDITSSRYLGQGICVAVLDSGICFHRDFGNRIAGFTDLISGKLSPYDDNGHGTHVSGILGGNGLSSNGIYGGIAPKCEFYMVKILDYRGHETIPHVLDGVHWLLKNHRKYNIRIVNISVGTLPTTNEAEEKELLAGVEALWDAGMVVVAAAGNYGPESGSVTMPGDSKKVITVGSSNDQSYIDLFGNNRRNYSGRGPTKECVCKPDVLAPGSYIVSTNVHFKKKGRYYTVKSGTSMSTPMVSGAVALLLSKYPDMSNIEVKMAIWQCCDDLGRPKNEQGYGLLNIERLLK